MNEIREGDYKQLETIEGSGGVLPNSPHSLLGWRRIDTTPG